MGREEHCIHAQDWGKVLELVDSHDKEIYGNGKPGLRDSVTELTIEMKSLSTTVHDLSTNVSAMLKYVNETAGENRERENQKKNKLTSWQITGIIFGIVFGCVTAYNVYTNIKEKRENKLVQNWMQLWDFSPITRGGQPILDTSKFQIKTEPPIE